MRRCASAKKCTFIFCVAEVRNSTKKDWSAKKHSGAHPDALFQQKLTESAKKSLSLLPKLTYHYL